MGQLTISIPDKLESKLRGYSKDRGQTISSLVTEMIREKLETNPSLTYWERVALVMQLENNRGDIEDKDWEFSRAYEVLKNGFVSEYENLFDYIERNEFSKSSSDYVIEVLVMYENMQRSAYDIKDEKIINLVKFPGFDGNNEADLLGFARYLQENDRFKHIKSYSSDMNSHGLEQPHYRSMLMQYQAILDSKSDPYQTLTVDEIHQILGK